MNKNKLGAQLRKARKSRQLSQTTVAEYTDIPRERLSQIENGHRPISDDEWRQLGNVLSLNSLRAPKPVELPVGPRFWHAPEPRLEQPEREAGARLFAARKAFGASTMDKLLAVVNGRADHVVCHEFLEQARVESSHEYIFWLGLLAAGAKPYRQSPVKAGFRQLAVVQPSSKEALGDVRVPCLELNVANCRILLFPQVTVDTRKSYFRLDVLACVRGKRDRCWINIEIDGQGHDPQFDLERQQMLGLPTIRLSKSDLVAPDILAVLERRIAPLLVMPEAS